MTDPNLSPDSVGDDVAPPPSTPTSTPKVPPPPLMGRAPRPGAVRIRKPVVQGAVMVAALLVSGSLAWAFVVHQRVHPDPVVERGLFAGRGVATAMIVNLLVDITHSFIDPRGSR